MGHKMHRIIGNSEGVGLMTNEIIRAWPVRKLERLIRDRVREILEASSTCMEGTDWGDFIDERVLPDVLAAIADAIRAVGSGNSAGAQPRPRGEEPMKKQTVKQIKRAGRCECGCRECSGTGDWGACDCGQGCCCDTALYAERDRVKKEKVK